MPARLLRGQLGLARALWWAVRGRADVGPDDEPLPYNGMDRPVLWTICVVGVVEVAVVHVLVSWPPLRWTLFAVGVYGLLSFVAFDLTMRQHPHLLRGGELLLRFGHFRSVRVPLEDLASVRKQVRNEHRKNLEVDDDAVALSFMGGTNVELRFSPAADVEVDGELLPATRVAFSAADPVAALAVLRTRTFPRERPTA